MGVRAVTTPAVLRNNIFNGNGNLCSQASAVLDHNFTMGDPKLADATNHDYHLLAGSPCAEAGADPGMGDGQALTPTYQYVHPTSFEKRMLQLKGREESVEVWIQPTSGSLEATMG